MQQDAFIYAVNAASGAFGETNTLDYICQQRITGTRIGDQKVGVVIKFRETSTTPAGLDSLACGRRSGL